MTLRRAVITLAAASAAFGAVTTASAEPHSNMGLCSAYLGHLQVRDDVNRIIVQNGDLFGIRSPGELYRVRAQQRDLGTAEQECEQR